MANWLSNQPFCSNILIISSECKNSGWSNHYRKLIWLYYVLLTLSKPSKNQSTRKCHTHLLHVYYQKSLIHSSCVCIIGLYYNIQIWVKSVQSEQFPWESCMYIKLSAKMFPAGIGWSTIQQQQQRASMGLSTLPINYMTSMVDRPFFIMDP